MANSISTLATRLSYAIQMIQSGLMWVWVTFEVPLPGGARLDERVRTAPAKFGKLIALIE